MIEFVLSKVLMISAGLILIVTLGSVFAQLDAEISNRAVEDEARSIANLLYQMNSSPPHSICTLKIGELHLPPGSQIQVANGSVWIKWSEGAVAAEGPQNLILNSSRLVLREDDSLTIELIFADGQRFLRLHSEKVATISPTASENFLLSSTVLYT